jgi:hypothetical protein
MRGCFESVTCGPGGMLSRGLRRLRIPDGFIELCEMIASSKENKVITEYGLAGAYHTYRM